MASAIFLCLISISLLVPTPAISQTVLSSLKLSLLWPNSFCLTKDVKCAKPIPGRTYTIFSLFAVDQNGQEVICSNPTLPMNQSEMEPLKDQLSKLWPDLQGKNMELWTYEWQRHASCIPVSPFEYFSASISLRSLIDQQLSNGIGNIILIDRVWEVLLLHNVQPGTGSFYPPIVYSDALYNSFKLPVEVQCNNDSTGSNQLLELHICSDLNLQLIACSNPPIFIDCSDNVRYT